MNRARVLLLNAAIGPLDYSVPAGMKVVPGSVVVVPLGPRKVIGIAWEPEQFDVEEVGHNRLRPIIELLDVPPLKAELRRLIEWTADYYLANIASVARMCLSSSAALRGELTVTEYRPTATLPTRMTTQREQALERLEAEQANVRELAEMAGVSESVIRGLIDQQCFEPVTVALDRPYPAPIADFAAPELSAEQTPVADELARAVAARQFAPFLLDGVTGSGKTEVYFEAIAEAIRQDRQVLVLLPEIALTQPFLKRFEARFGVAPVCWHSSLKQGERRRAWRAISRGEARVVVGARSALFLPFSNLGLAIVDEAHETSFKQEEGVRYNARDVVVMRGQFEGFPVVLASATPAIESRHMAELGRYRTLVLPARFGGASEPDVRAVDLREDKPPPGHWIAPSLRAELETNLAAGEQSLLFLNRRGFAPLTLCRNCGHRFKCPNCSAWMVEHRLVARLACHHCGHVMPPPENCAECGEPDCLVACGPGVERIRDEVAEILPQARTALITSDTIWSPERAAEFVANVEQGLVDIIVGTQLVTKGYHFPNLTLVGVIDADLGLDGGDLRAAERCFQQIAQVAGRAGRAEKEGRVLVQTRNPGSPVIDALVRGDRDAFYAAETEARRLAGVPPFGRMAAIILSSEDNNEAIEASRAIGASAPKRPGFEVYGPAPAPLSMLRGRYRHRLLVQATRAIEMQDIIREWLDPIEVPRGVRVSVDVDPYSFV